PPAASAPRGCRARAAGGAPTRPSRARRARSACSAPSTRGARRVSRGAHRDPPPSRPPLRPADVPEKQRSFGQLVGPGAVLVGLAIGAGELIVWPRLTAMYGAGM